MYTTETALSLNEIKLVFSEIQCTEDVFDLTKIG